jgi:hypothetical protein
MYPSLSRLQVFILLCAAVLLVYLGRDIGTSNSIDLAHHYVLAFRLAQDWHLAPGDITLGEMNFYPRASHAAAAAVGKALHSTFLGLQVMSLAGLALVWGALIGLLNMLPARMALAASTLLAGLLWANHRWLGLDVHGSEIVGNFFYSQLVAQGLALLALAIAVRLETTRSAQHAGVFLVAAIYGIASVHLLPALELLGTLCLVQCIALLTLARPWRERGRAAAGAVLYMVAGLAAILLNPAFAAMRQIAEINGHLTLVLVSDTGRLVVLCLLALAAACMLLQLWRREREQMRALKFLGAYGAAIALLCLLQLVLLRFGFGSEYAIKKYAFGLTTFVFIVLAVFGGSLVRRFGAGLRVAPAFAGIATTVVAVVTLGIAFDYSARRVKLTDTSDIVAFERQLIGLQQGALKPAVAGTANVIVDLQNQPWTINYLFSIAVARTPRDMAMQRVLATNKLGPLSQYDTILGSRGASRYEFSGCQRPGSGTILLLDAACVDRFIQARLACTSVVDFTEHGAVLPVMVEGFSWPQPEQRWTDGNRARFSCMADTHRKTARIVLAPYLQGAHQRQHVGIAVNGGSPVQVEFNGDTAPRTVELPLPLVAPGTMLEFVIDTPDAISPQQLGVNSDGRRLGVAVRTISFQ